LTIQTQLTDSTPVYVELGSKRVFACALDWPGWCRSGKDERQALQALADYAARYAAVPSVAGVEFSADTATTFEVRERLPGSATTDFGAPDRVPSSDREPLGPAEAEGHPPARGSPREPSRPHAQAERCGVDEHVRGVGEQGQRVRDEREDDLSRHERDDQAERDRERAHLGLGAHTVVVTMPHGRSLTP
jgi:hypothetical protein